MKEWRKKIVKDEHKLYSIEWCVQWKFEISIYFWIILLQQSFIFKNITQFYIYFNDISLKHHFLCLIYAFFSY